MTAKKIIFIVGGIVGLLLVLGVAVTLMLPAERIGRLAAAQAEDVLDREVGIERVRLRFLPRPAIALDGVAVSRYSRPDGAIETAGSGAEEPYLASVDRISLRPRLLPLLRRQVIIDEVIFDAPRITLEIDEGGELNLPTFEDSGEAGTGDAMIDVRRLVIRDGQASYRDANDGTVVTLGGINQTIRLSGSIMDGELATIALRGSLSIAEINADLPGVVAFPIRNIRLAIDHDVLLDQGADRLDLDRLTLTIQDIALDVSGTVHALSDPAIREVALRAAAENLDIAALIAALPSGLATRGENGETLRGIAGRAEFDATVTGRVGEDAIPDVAGQLRLDDVALAYNSGGVAGGMAGSLIDGLAGAIVFSQDSVATQGLTGRLLGEPFGLAFHVQDLAEPRGTVTLNGALDLGEATRIGLLREDVRGTGRLVIEMAAEGALLDPDAALVNGSIGLGGVEIQLPDVGYPLLVREGNVRFTGRRLGSEEIDVAIGRSDVRLAFEANDWLTLALADAGAAGAEADGSGAGVAVRAAPVPAVTFDVRSNIFDADDVLGYDPDRITYGQIFFAHMADRPVEGTDRMAGDVAEELEMALPEIPMMRMDGRIRAGRVISDSLVYQDVTVTLAAREGNLEVRAADFRMMGGDVRLSARLGSATAAAAAPRPLNFQYTVTDVSADPFLERFTAFRGRVGGTLLLAGSGQMMLEPNTLPVRESVMSEGTIAILDGELRNWPVAMALGERLGVGAFERLAFRDWSGRYRMAGPRILLEESEMEAGEMRVRTAGSFGVAGDLDLAATLEIPQQWAGRIPGAPAGFLAALSVGEEGRIPIGARFSGTTTSPSVALDLSEAGAAAARQARERVEAEARERAERALEELGVTVPPRDSLAAQADSLRKKAEEEVRDRLRRIIPRRGGEE